MKYLWMMLNVCKDGSTTLQSSNCMDYGVRCSLATDHVSETVKFDSLVCPLPAILVLKFKLSYQGGYYFMMFDTQFFQLAIFDVIFSTNLVQLLL